MNVNHPSNHLRPQWRHCHCTSTDGRLHQTGTVKTSINHRGRKNVSKKLCLGSKHFLAIDSEIQSELVELSLNSTEAVFLVASSRHPHEDVSMSARILMKMSTTSRACRVRVANWMRKSPCQHADILAKKSDTLKSRLYIPAALRQSWSDTRRCRWTINAVTWTLINRCRYADRMCDETRRLRLSRRCHVVPSVLWLLVGSFDP